MVENEQLAELVIAEVLRRLRLKSDNQSAGEQVQPKVLAVFTGGTTGLETALTELQLLQANAEIIVALSPAAEKIAGAARIREKLGADIALITAQSPHSGDLLADIELVLVPVLTQNTAAKLALTLADTFVTTVISRALLCGKPVLAVPDAADPTYDKQVQHKAARPAPALVRALQDNLKKLETFGIAFVAVSQLAAEARKLIASKGNTKAAPAAAKTFIDAQAVTAAAKNGTKTLIIPKGSIITPLARDVARDCNMEFISGDC